MTHYAIIDTQHDHYPTVKHLIESVLRKPLGQSLDQDDITVHQNGYIHILTNDNNEVVACCCTVPGNKPQTRQLRHMLTHPKHLKKNYGSQLLHHVETSCRQQNISLLYAYARAAIIDFYLKNDYITQGAIFIESSTQLPHQYIEKHL